MEAMQVSERIIAGDPRNITALSVKARALAAPRVARYKEALAICDLMMSIEPNSALTLLTRGKVLSDLGQSDAELAFYDQALARDPMNTNALGFKTASLVRLSRPQEALLAAQSAMRIKPASVLAQVAYSLALTATKQHKEAIKVADRAIAENPKDYRPWTAKGAAFSDKGEMFQSRIAWGRVKALEPEFDPVGEVFKQQEQQSVKHECHQAEYPSTRREDGKG